VILIFCSSGEVIGASSGEADGKGALRKAERNDFLYNSRNASKKEDYPTK
jgi:hypothetical protein